MQDSSQGAPGGTLEDRALHDQLEDVHKILSWVLAPIVVAHLAAAFFHLRLRRDDVIHRMLPARRRRSAHGRS